MVTIAPVMCFWQMDLCQWRQPLKAERVAAEKTWIEQRIVMWVVKMVSSMLREIDLLAWQTDLWTGSWMLGWSMTNQMSWLRYLSHLASWTAGKDLCV